MSSLLVVVLCSDQAGQAGRAGYAIRCCASRKIATHYYEEIVYSRIDQPN